MADRSRRDPQAPRGWCLRPPRTSRLSRRHAGHDPAERCDDGEGWPGCGCGGRARRRSGPGRSGGGRSRKRCGGHDVQSTRGTPREGCRSSSIPSPSTSASPEGTGEFVPWWVLAHRIVALSGYSADRDRSVKHRPPGRIAVIAHSLGGKGHRSALRARASPAAASRPTDMPAVDGARFVASSPSCDVVWLGREDRDDEKR